MIKAAIPTLILLLLLTGCWDLTEAEKIGMATLMGIDAAEDRQVRVLIQEMTAPQSNSGGQSGGGSDKSPVELHEATAPTVTGAVEKIIAASMRLPDFSHTYAIVLSEELVTSMGIQPFIDFMERTTSVRRHVWVFIAKKGQFDKICDPDISDKSHAEPGRRIMEISHNKASSSIISTNRLGDFLNMLWDRGSEPYTSGLTLTEAGTGTGGGKDESGSYDLKAEDTALFKDGRMVGWLGKEESTGLLLVKGDIKGGILTVNTAGSKLSLRIAKAAVKIKPRIVNGSMEADIRIKVTSNLGESQINLDFTDTAVIKSIEQLQAEEIKKQILAAHEKTKQLNTDVFGLGNYFLTEYPEVWRKIEAGSLNYYEKIKLNIEVESKVNNIGLVKKPSAVIPVR